MNIIRAIRNRLNERSTWLLIGSGIGTAAMLPAPWSIVSAVVHVAAALVPDGAVKG
jgi:hypothetical protein